MGIQKRGDKFQLTVKHKLLPKAFYHSFDTEDAATAYGQQLKKLLDKGLVPVELANPDNATSPKVVDVIDWYRDQAPITASDSELLNVVGREVVGVTVKTLTFSWVEKWVRELKVKQNLAPGSIRKRVEGLARVIDWHLLKTIQNKSGNPLRMLPRGYSTYSDQDKALLPADKSVRTDVERNRRLAPSEYERVLAALSGVKRDDRERALAVDPAFILLFDLILDTGLRLMEAFRLRVDQVDLAKGILLVEGTKGHRGVLKPRNVPLKGAIRAKLAKWVEGREGLIFPFWDGTKEDQKRASKRLTLRFGTLFEYAGLKDITERDLRHEAACRWFELRKPDGSWHFSDVAVCKIMGWSDYSMILRYASLRGEDLSAGLD